MLAMAVLISALTTLCYWAALEAPTYFSGAILDNVRLTPLETVVVLQLIGMTTSFITNLINTHRHG